MGRRIVTVRVLPFVLLLALQQLQLLLMFQQAFGLEVDTFIKGERINGWFVAKKKRHSNVPYL